MKTIFKTILFALTITTTSSIWSQTSYDTIESTNTKTVELNNEELYTIQTETEAIQAIVLDPEDKGKLNQDLLDTPVMVSKIISIDMDKDEHFDKKISMFYSKDDEDKLKYTASSEGITFKTNDNTSKMFSKPGIYQINTKEIKNVIIIVEDTNSKK